jgi:site-specific DNA recombinase
MPRAMSYARVAVRKQAEDDLSIAHQLATIRRHATANGWRIIGEYVDEGVSGATDRRPGFQRMIDDALSGQADLILVQSLSRLFRNHFLFEMYCRKLKEKGIGILSITEVSGGNESALMMQQDLERVVRKFPDV